MRHALQQLRTACLPFVTRALRGPRRRRFALGSALLGLLVILIGTWAARSPGDLARDVRVGLHLEQPRWDREQLEFTIFVDDELERRQIIADGKTGPHYYGAMRYRSEEGWTLLDTVASPHVYVPEPYRDLAEQALHLRNARVDLAPDDLVERRQYQSFDWGSSHDRRRLQAILDAELQPRVVVYSSPLGASEATRLVGALAGGLLLLLSLVVAPLWVGVHVAQELHENTLQPLTGTALTSGQLVLGLVVGALTPVGFAALPPLLLHVGAAALAGSIVPALGFVAMTLAMGAMLIGLSMLLALGLGRRRAPGIVGIGLLALLGMATMIGLGLGLELRGSSLGAVTVVPAAGPGHLLAESFFPVNHLDAFDAIGLDLRLVLATAGALVLATLAMRAIERVVGGTHRDGALHRGEAALAAGTLLVLATAALPEHDHFGETLLAAAALALIPLQLVLMGRVPGGDVPPALRRIPVLALVREHFAWLAGAVVLALVVAGPPSELRPGIIIGLIHLGWALVVTMLVTIRTAGLPTNVLGKLWLMVCVIMAMIEYATAAVWCLDSPDVELMFPLAKASPLLGLVHLGLFLWIPVSLIKPFAPPVVEASSSDGAATK